MPESSEIPNGFVFFAPGTPAGYRRRRVVVALVVLAAAVALIWPVYPLFGSVYPLVLGLPLSLAWVVLWLAVVFGALMWLFRSEERDGGPQTADRCSS